MNPRRSPCSSARNARKRIAQAFSLGRSSSRKIFAVQIFFGSPVFLRGRGFKTNRIKTKERKAKTFRSFVVEVTGLEPSSLPLLVGAQCAKAHCAGFFARSLLFPKNLCCANLFREPCVFKRSRVQDEPHKNKRAEGKNLPLFCGRGDGT